MVASCQCKKSPNSVDSKGILSLVDIAQSAGILPISLADWQADFVLGSCVKWIGGGPGAAFIWVNPEIIDRCSPKMSAGFPMKTPSNLIFIIFVIARMPCGFGVARPRCIPMWWQAIA